MNKAKKQTTKFILPKLNWLIVQEGANRRIEGIETFVCLLRLHPYFLNFCVIMRPHSNARLSLAGLLPFRPVSQPSGKFLDGLDKTLAVACRVTEANNIMHVCARRVLALLSLRVWTPPQTLLELAAFMNQAATSLHKIIERESKVARPDAAKGSREHAAAVLVSEAVHARKAAKKNSWLLNQMFSQASGPQASGPQAHVIPQVPQTAVEPWTLSLQALEAELSKPWATRAAEQVSKGRTTAALLMQTYYKSKLEELTLDLDVDLSQTRRVLACMEREVDLAWQLAKPRADADAAMLFEALELLVTHPEHKTSLDSWLLGRMVSNRAQELGCPRATRDAFMCMLKFPGAELGLRRELAELLRTSDSDTDSDQDPWTERVARVWAIRLCRKQAVYFCKSGDGNSPDPGLVALRDAWLEVAAPVAAVELKVAALVLRSLAKDHRGLPSLLASVQTMCAPSC